MPSSSSYILKTTVLTLAVCLQGCPSLKPWTFKAAPESGQSRGQVNLSVYSAEPSEKDSWKTTTDAYPGLGTALENCKMGGAESAAAIIVPVVGKLLFDSYIDSRTRKLDEIAESASKAYSAQFTVYSDQLTNAVIHQNCVVITRVSAEGITDFVSVLKLRPVPERIHYTAETFAFQPTYVAVKSAAAVTSASDAPTISTSFAITVSGIGQQENGLPTMGVIGAATTVVPNIPIGAAAKNKPACLKTACPISGPIPLDSRSTRYSNWLDQFEEEGGTVKTPGSILPPPKSIPLNEYTVLQVGVSVIEAGDVGQPFDAEKSELAAIKEAMGPAISDLLKERYK